MTFLKPSRHAVLRMSQRGMREGDLECLLRYGTEIGCGLVMMRDSDVRTAIAKHELEIRRLRRLCGMAIALDGGTVLTAYRPTRGRLKRVRRRSR